MDASEFMGSGRRFEGKAMIFVGPKKTTDTLLWVWGRIMPDPIAWVDLDRLHELPAFYQSVVCKAGVLDRAALNPQTRQALLDRLMDGTRMLIAAERVDPDALGPLNNRLIILPMCTVN